MYVMYWIFFSCTPSKLRSPVCRRWWWVWKPCPPPPLESARFPPQQQQIAASNTPSCNWYRPIRKQVIALPDFMNFKPRLSGWVARHWWAVTRFVWLPSSYTVLTTSVQFSPIACGWFEQWDSRLLSKLWKNTLSSGKLLNRAKYWLGYSSAFWVYKYPESTNSMPHELYRHVPWLASVWVWGFVQIVF